ncbi:lysophospholipid acyltransferase family protein [Aeoliella mucimassa]|uniref:DUF374 domain-containing protein n=1 Tax=Aeoliella mucimassa TaxID=2527972 RepID=A0A518ANN3_9BACT|nr:lysophospholipid acyltransferase family protein [Aeoliella mucimassa]QDU56328.1 hypothetical protein Pan181_25370 [Aeoliella mucimassa]
MRPFAPSYGRDIPLRIKSSLLTSIGGFLFASALWLLFRTLRHRLITGTPNTNPYAKDLQERYLYSVWHDTMVMPVFGGKHRCTTALTSQHSDGSFVAQVIRWRNVPAVRGSTNRISTGAIRRLLDATGTRHLVITPDGPRGPNRKMSMGIVYLASRSGRAIVPTAFDCSRCWRWKGSWSDLIIPKPFSTIVLIAGEPIYVPDGLSTDELREYVDKAQAAMDRLNEQARAELGFSTDSPSDRESRQAA